MIWKREVELNQLGCKSSPQIYVTEMRGNSDAVWYFFVVFVQNIEGQIECEYNVNTETNSIWEILLIDLNSGFMRYHEQPFAI